jgi:hypothetical protein
VLQCRGLGLDADVFADDGLSRAAPGLRGELGCGAAFPCAPLRFLGDDAEGTKYRASYFDADFGGGAVWKHGDFCERDKYSDGFVILGRSDATLNPGGACPTAGGPAETPLSKGRPSRPPTPHKKVCASALRRYTALSTSCDVLTTLARRSSSACPTRTTTVRASFQHRAATRRP